MYDWEEMAGVVARKLVESGQSRILQRIYDGVTSNWVLDVADDKSSLDHHLIHLVWRKFPRSQHPSEERRPTAVSTQTDEQTDEASSAVLGLDASAGLSRPLRKILEKDCYSSSDLGNLFETKNNTSCSDAGSSSDCFSSGLEESELTSYDYSPEDTSYIPPPKRRSGKPLFIEKKFQPELSNRFDCLEELSPPENSNVNAELKDRELAIVSQGIRPCSPPKTKPKSKIPEIPKTTFAKSSESPLTSAIPTTSTQEDDSSKLRRKGIVKWFDSSRMSYGFITMDSKVVFFHVNNIRKGENYVLIPGEEVTFILHDYDKGAIDVKFLPTLSVFPSISDFPKGEVESHPGDESWETVDPDSENDERPPSGPPSEELVEDEEETKIRNIENKLQIVEGQLQNLFLHLDSIFYKGVNI